MTDDHESKELDHLVGSTSSLSIHSEGKYSETQDFRIALLGNVDSGKSTLTGVLAKGILDDGRGIARSFVLRHRHEQERGQTSSVSTELIGFAHGQQVIPRSLHNVAAGKARASHVKEFYDVATAAEYRCQLVDLCGHEKFLKTTIYGLTGMSPNCAMIIVGANHGILKMTREHLGLCHALGVPFFVIVTKIDICPEGVFKETKMQLKRVLRMAGKRAYYVKDAAIDIPMAASSLSGNNIAPVFEVSSKTGENIELLRKFIQTITQENLISPERVLSEGSVEGDQSLTDAQVINEFFIDDVFQVPGVGVVLGGTLRNGPGIRIGARLLVGPDRNGGFKLVSVKSIHKQCVPCDHLSRGQHATINIRAVGKDKEGLKKIMFRKGMVCVNEEDKEILRQRVVRDFVADIKVLHHSTTINPGYSPVVHLGVIRQAAVILWLKDKEGKETIARTGSEVTVGFRFLHYAEYLNVGRNIIFREGRAKGCGKVTELQPKSEAVFH